MLFPPAALALVSNNAIPGDATYPIKRGLENVIYSVASINSTTKAWFAKARSDRRFQEIKILITQGKKTSETLSELVEQTQVAASQIEKIADSVEKEKFISQLSDSITKYNQGLSQISESPASLSNPILSPSSVPSPAIIPTVSLKPQPLISSKPTPISNQTSTPTPNSSSSPSPSSTPSPSPIGQNDIDKTRDQLDKIKEKLEQQKQKQKEDHDKRQERQNKEDKDKKDKQDKQDKDKNDDKSSKKGRN